jgi:hypothetical protein
VIIGLVLGVARGAVSLSLVRESCPLPGGGAVVAQRALPGVVVGGLLRRVAGDAVGLSLVAEGRPLPGACVVTQ